MHWMLKWALIGAWSLSLLLGGTLSFGEVEIRLAWDATTEADLAGYKVYYGFNQGGPYDGTGLEQGDSPIDIPLDSLDDPDNPTLTLTGMDEYETYYIVVTAYDADGNESDYSNEVFWFLCHAHEDEPGNGESGCFISVLIWRYYE